MIFIEILRAKFFKKEFKKINEKLDLIIHEVTPKPELTITFMFKDIQVSGGKLMYVVKNDNPDVNYTITPPAEVKDAEGEVIPNPELVYEVSSTDPSVLAVTPSADDPKVGSVHFGTSGVATFNVTVKNTSGTMVGSGAASFTVTVGDPASISPIALSFEGLTEVPEA